MMKDINNKYLIISSVVLVLLIAGGFIYVKKIKTSSPSDSETATTTIDNILIDGENMQDVIIEPIAIENNLPKAPNLDGKIIFNIELSAEQRAKAESTIKEIIATLKKDSTDFYSWIDLGSNRKMVGDYKGAIEAWVYAGQLSPTSNLPFNNLGSLYHYELKDFVKSEENFKKAIANNQTYVVSYLNLFELYSLSYKQNTSLAEDTLLEGLEKNPNNLNLLMALADYYNSKGRVDDAVTYYNKALKEAKTFNDASLISGIEDILNSLK